MSTKIYEAYRLPVGRLNEFLSDVREEIISMAAEAIKIWAENLRPEYVAEEIEKAAIKNKLLEPEDNFRWRFYLCLEPLLEESSKSSQKSYFDIDSSFNVWLDGKYAYVIPYTSFKYTKADYVEDYAYWNNTDRPESITGRQWNARAKRWEEICLNDWNKTRLEYVVIDYSKLTGPGRFEIMQKLGLW